MCGIAGKWVWRGPVNDDSVRKMCLHLSHRGPDDEGVLRLPNVVLGHRRLSIIDLSEKGRQPMACRDGRYHIVYNGEVYNFKELRAELKLLGVPFKSETDTEVVLQAYIQWGVACLNKFNGMFALAVWDNEAQELFLARDRFGKKPLYYYQDADKFIFASELSALACDPEVPQKISYASLNCFLALGYILAPGTWYESVQKLEAASFMLVSDGGRKVQKALYWDYADTFRNKVTTAPKQIEARILELLRQSVQRRLVSDVPLGAFLSGGIDSSAIAALAKQAKGELHTFSVGFESRSFNELPQAALAGRAIGTIHHEAICRMDSMDEAIDAYDEPFADNSLVPTFALAKLASSRVKAALSGDGADEIFAGYPTYRADRSYAYAQVFPVPMRRMLFDALKDDSGRRKTSTRFRLKQFLQGSLFARPQAHYAWRLMFNAEERVKILGESFRPLVYDTDPGLTFEKYGRQAQDLEALDRHLYVDAMTWLTDDILVKIDRASMHFGLEVRCPFLDIDLVTYAASIPSELKMKGFNTKYILKRALQGVLPEEILNKPKSGFNAPIGFKEFNRYVFDRKIQHAAT